MTKLFVVLEKNLLHLILSRIQGKPIRSVMRNRLSGICFRMISCHRTKNRAMEIPGFKAFQKENDLKAHQIYVDGKKSKPPMIGRCGHCDKTETVKNEFLKCGACKLVLYCSRKCQKSGWIDHKVICKSKNS